MRGFRPEMQAQVTGISLLEMPEYLNKWVPPPNPRGWGDTRA